MFILLIFNVCKCSNGLILIIIIISIFHSSHRREAQPCYCESENCRGFIGATDVSDEVDIELEEESESEADSVKKAKPAKATAMDKLKEEFEDLAVSFPAIGPAFCCFEQSSNLTTICSWVYLNLRFSSAPQRFPASDYGF